MGSSRAVLSQECALLASTHPGIALHVDSQDLPNEYSFDGVTDGQCFSSTFMNMDPVADFDTICHTSANCGVCGGI